MGLSFSGLTHFHNLMTAGDLKAALFLVGMMAVFGLLVTAIYWMIQLKA